jgi:hypothetical protein
MYAHCEYTLLWSVQPLLLLSYPFTSYPPFFNSFQYTSLYHLASYLMSCDITDALSFSFPEFQSSSTITNILYIWVCIWSCLFLYICLSLDLSTTYKRKHVAFMFLSLGYFTKHYVLQLHPFTFKPHVTIPYDWVILHCVCIPHFLDPFLSRRTPGWDLFIHYFLCMLVPPLYYSCCWGKQDFFMLLLPCLGHFQKMLWFLGSSNAVKALTCLLSESRYWRISRVVTLW